MELIKVKYNILNKDFCLKIINFFEKSKSKHEGVTSLGLNKLIKNTIDLHLMNEKDFREEALEIDNELHKINSKNLENYLKEINFLNNSSFIDHGFQIQKYTKNEGFYIEHVDQKIDCEKRNHRVLTYLYYLNDVEEGGETVFLKNHKIKPEAGKLVIFPATWCYPHEALKPISNDKYIVTGWLYADIH